MPSTSYNTTTLSVSSHNRNREILLSTVQVRIRDQRGNTRLARALLDSCSQFSFMTSKCCKKLDLRCTPDHLSVQGIGGSTVVSRQVVAANVLSRSPNLPQFNREMNFFVLPELTSVLPNQNVDITAWKLPENIILADPSFNEPGEVDLIIGAEHYFDLLRDGRSNITDNGPVLQNTVFGWVVSGCVPRASTSLPVAVVRRTNRRNIGLWRPARQFNLPQRQQLCSSFDCTSKRCTRIRQSAENQQSVSHSVQNYVQQLSPQI